MAGATDDRGRKRRLRIGYVALAIWFVVLAGAVSVLASSVAAGGLALGLFGLGYAGSVLLMEPGLLPSAGLRAATRRCLRTSMWAAALVIAPWSSSGSTNAPRLPSLSVSFRRLRRAVSHSGRRSHESQDAWLPL